MNKNLDDCLERLFKTARTVKPDVSKFAEGFEERVMARLRENQNNEIPLFSWTWRLAPVMTVLLLILLILNAVFEPQRSHDIFSPLINGYDQSQVKKYFTGE